MVSVSVVAGALSFVPKRANKEINRARTEMIMLSVDSSMHFLLSGKNSVKLCQSLLKWHEVEGI